MPRAHKISQDVPLEQEYVTGHSRWFTYAPAVTGLRLICLEDLHTKTVVTTTVANSEKRTAAHRAWAGARQSRAAGTPWKIMHEMGEKGVDPDQKIEEMFRSYGHASVGDMARLAVDMGSIPMHFNLALFSQGTLNSGQEKSTRYQSAFGKTVLHPMQHYLPSDFAESELADLEKEYQTFGAHALDSFAHYRASLLPLFMQHYQIDTNDPQQKSALNSRVLDCVRYFLLLGQWSGISFETSARDWSRILAELKAAPLPYYQRVAAQIEKLLAPTGEEESILGYKAEAPGLLKYTDPALTTNQNLHSLKRFLVEKSDLLQHVTIRRGSPVYVEQRVSLLESYYTEGTRLVAEYILLLWPGMQREQLLAWVHTQSGDTQRAISAILFNKHSNYNELPAFARTTRMTLVVESSLGELRDLNRHRAWGRFFPLPLVFGASMTKDTAQQIIANGFGLPLYLEEVPAFAELKAAFVRDLTAYYQRLSDFLEKVHTTYGETIDYSFVLNLLPLAHHVDLWMHGDPKQALYLTMQRSRPGGHINYRRIAYDANQLIAASDPYLSAIQLQQRPDPASRTEFLDRS